MLSGLIQRGPHAVPLAVAPVLALVVLCMAIVMVHDSGVGTNDVSAAPPLLLFDSLSTTPSGPMPSSSSSSSHGRDLYTEFVVQQEFQTTGETLTVLDNARTAVLYKVFSRMYLIRSKSYVVTDFQAERDVAKAVLRRGCWGIVCPPWRRDAYLDTWDIQVSPASGLHHAYVMRQYYGNDWFGDGHWEVSTRLPGGRVGDVQIVIPRTPVTHSILFCVPETQAPGSGAGLTKRCPRRLGMMVADWEDGVYVWKLRLYVSGDHSAVPVPLALAILSVVNRHANAKFVVRSRFASDALGVPGAAGGSLADPSMDRRLTPHQLMGLGAPLSSRHADLLRDMTSEPDPEAAERYFGPDDPRNTPVSFTDVLPATRGRQQSLRPGS